MVMDLSTEDKASGVKFCSSVHWHLCRESPIFVNFARLDAQNQMNRPEHEGQRMFQLVTLRRAYQVRVACGRRISMCVYTSPKTDVFFVLSRVHLDNRRN